MNHKEKNIIYILGDRHTHITHIKLRHKCTLNSVSFRCNFIECPLYLFGRLEDTCTFITTSYMYLVFQSAK